MTPADLVRATIAGERTPRPAFSFWTHFPGIDLDPDAIARETVAFTRATGADFVKSMPNGLYVVEDWGVRADYSEIAAGGVAKVTASPIQAPEDWTRVKRLDPTAGVLGRELRHLGLLVEALGPAVPVLATVFSPVTIAKKLIGGNGFATHLRDHPALVQAAMAEMAETTAAFSRAAIALGCAGVFFAVQDATSAVGDAAYRRDFLAHDLAALEGAKAGWFNAVHMHGDDILFDLLSDLPVPVLNWHIGETAPSIAQYRAAGGRKPILGGLRRTPITQGDMNAIEDDLAAIRASGDGVLISPGCVIRHPVDTALLARIGARIRGEA
ncbi:uroporphyrinogen decarboxylase family protein [Falsiroseomonas ponticola]|uniref:uroporphyrinogen decarboxylase family protein n=1 Tax=Falsiroseomonas ponticola TaxID=2786951 RepID=UPI001933E461|nr:uroporphyrinogen decarboxylase family protein [Roseomonas ponticola]